MDSQADRGARLSRRRVLGALAPLLCVGMAGMPMPAGAVAAATALRDSRFMLGTRVDVQVQGRDPSELAAAMDAAFAEMSRLSETMMSRYAADSVLSRLNRAAGQIGPAGEVSIPREMRPVLELGQSLYRQTDGLFDMSIGALKSWHFELGQAARLPPEAEIRAQARRVHGADVHFDARRGLARLARPGMALDLGGVAKLPILAAGLQRLQDWGIRDALVNGGGDVLYLGRSRSQPWRVGLRDPLQPARVMAVAHLHGQGVLAASGDYERCFIAQGQRQHHVLDPRTARPSQGLRGVYLMAREVEALNGLGVPFMIGGAAFARDFLAARPEVQALLVDAQGQRLPVAQPALSWLA